VLICKRHFTKRR